MGIAYTSYMDELLFELLLAFGGGTAGLGFRSFVLGWCASAAGIYLPRLPASRQPASISPKAFGFPLSCNPRRMQVSLKYAV